MGGGWQGASGDPRWLAADPRPALAPAPGMPTKEAIWVRKAAAQCCPRAQPKCGGPRDWSPPPSSQECTALRRGSHLSRFTQLRTGVLTAEPGSASFHCQTFFLEVRPPSQGASCWEHSPPTPPPQRAWPRKEFKAGSGDPAASVEAAPPRAGSGCVPSPLSHLPCHVFRLRRQGLSSGQLPAAGLWVTEQGNPGLCARSGAFLRVPAQGTGQEGALGESLARVPPASSSPPGPLRGPRGRRTSPPSLCPLQGLSCPKDHAEAPSATRATSRAPPETQEGRRDHDRPSLHRRGRAPGAQRFPKVLLPLGESPRAWGRGRAAAPALRNFGARPRGRK